MVFQKKNTPKGKQQIAAKSKKKAFEMENDLEDIAMDFDDELDDDSDDHIMKKTPKGRQSLNDKRVSFQIPGKNTPADKTPKNTAVSKKQATPGKAGALKEFQGMLANSAKKNGKAKRAVPEEEEEEDDDDDDDDDDDEDEDADLDMMLGDDDDDDDEDDDDDDDEDDDDDDEDDDDDDDDDDDEEQPKSKKHVKQQNQSKNAVKKVAAEGQNKTPVKVLEKTLAKNDKMKKSVSAKESESPKVTSPKKTEKKDNTNPAIKNFLELDAERRKERDRTTLYIGNLPKDITATELKALSADILSVNIPQSMKKRKNAYAFVQFASEAKAEENIKILKSKKLRGEPVTIDFTGEKSQNAKSGFEQSERPYNLKKLFVPALPADATIDEIARFFPKAIQICLTTNPTYRNATVLFLTEKEAADALEATKSAKLGSKPMTVMYSIQRDGKIKKRKRSKGPKASNKKIKLEIKQDSDDDDDDDDDDDE